MSASIRRQNVPTPTSSAIGSTSNAKVRKLAPKPVAFATSESAMTVAERTVR